MPPAAPPDSEPACPTPRARLLVVDDDANVARSIERLLRRTHDVTSLNDPEAAVRRIVEHGDEVDLILCDLMMPGTSGMDVYERVVAAAPRHARKFIFMTGGAFTERARAFLAEDRPTLEKPFDPARLRSFVDARVRALRA